MIYALIFLAVYTLGVGMIVHVGTVGYLEKQLLSTRQSLNFSLVRRRELEQALELTRADLDQLVERDAESFNELTATMAYGVEVLPSCETDYIVVHASMPALDFQYQPCAPIHRKSLDIMAKRISHGLADASYKTALDFFTNKMKFGTII